MKNSFVSEFQPALLLNGIITPRHIIGIIVFFIPFTMGGLQTYHSSIFFWIWLSKYYIWICWIFVIFLISININDIIFHRRQLKRIYTILIILYSISFLASMYFSPGYSDVSSPYILNKTDFNSILFNLIVTLPLQFFLLFTIYLSLKGKKDFFYVFNVFLYTGILVNFISLLFFISETTWQGRLGGPFHDSNYLGRYQVFLVIISLSYILFGNLKLLQKVLLSINIFVCISILYFTFSRGSVLTLAIVVCVIFLFTKKRFFKYGIISAVLIIALYALIFLAAQRGAGSGSGGISSAFFDLSNFTRLILNVSAIQMFIDYPIFGVGHSNFYNMFSNEFYMIPGVPIATNVTYIHSWFFNVLAEQGLFGTIPLCFLLILVLVDLRKIISQAISKEERLIGIILFSLFFSLIAFEMFYPDFYDELILPVLGGMIGAYFKLYRTPILLKTQGKYF